MNFIFKGLWRRVKGQFALISAQLGVIHKQGVLLMATLDEKFAVQNAKFDVLSAKVDKFPEAINTLEATTKQALTELRDAIAGQGQLTQAQSDAFDAFAVKLDLAADKAQGALDDAGDTGDTQPDPLVS